jgi:hypothetical protein
MKANGVDSPKIPVPGAAGVAIAAALQGLVMQAGGGTVNIHKRPVAGGGYVYEISRDSEMPRAT